MQNQNGIPIPDRIVQVTQTTKPMLHLFYFSKVCFNNELKILVVKAGLTMEIRNK